MFVAGMAEFHQGEPLQFAQPLPALGLQLEIQLGHGRRHHGGQVPILLPGGGGGRFDRPGRPFGERGGALEQPSAQGGDLRGAVGPVEQPLRWGRRRAQMMPQPPVQPRAPARSPMPALRSLAFPLGDARGDVRRGQ